MRCIIQVVGIVVQKMLFLACYGVYLTELFWKGQPKKVKAL